MKRIRALVITIGVIAGIFGSASFVDALGVMPKPLAGEPNRSWFIYAMQPGDTKEDVVSISNNGKDAITAAVEALDAANTSDGGFTLVEDPADNKDVGKWITLSKTEVTIPSGQSVDVPFKVTVPSDASIGQHSAGIAVYERNKQAPSGAMLKVRVGARIYITIPGKVTRKLTWQSASYEIKDGKLIFKLQARNDSNVNIEPGLDVIIQGIFGSVRETQDKNGTYLPGSTIAISKTWTHTKPWLGFYRIKLVLHTMGAEEVLPDGKTNRLPDQQFAYSMRLWVGTRWIFIILGALLLLWLGYRICAYLMDRIKYRTRTEVYVAKSGESIMHIAEKTNVFPQSIIKFNELRWPFTLNAGDRLLIPAGELSPDELLNKQTSQPMLPFWSYLLSYSRSLYHPAAVGKPKPSPRLSTRLAKKKPIRKKR